MAGFMMKSFLFSVLAKIGIAAVLPTHESFAIGTKAALVRKEAPSDKVVVTKMKKAKDKDSDYCDYHYVPGTINTVDCATETTGAAHTDGKLLHRIEDMSMCREAAQEAFREASASDATLTESDFIDANFEIDAGCYGDNYPKRCFQKEPAVAGGHKMWYFNDVGYTPTNLGGQSSCYPASVTDNSNASQGTPVCSTKEFDNGTLAVGVVTCPAGMSVISHEDTCRSAATCLGICDQEMFNVINVTHAKVFPLGCHINPEDGCAQFSELAVNAGDMASMIGTPLCNVTTGDAAGAANGTANGTAAPAEATTAAPAAAL